MDTIVARCWGKQTSARFPVGAEMPAMFRFITRLGGHISDETTPLLGLFSGLWTVLTLRDQSPASLYLLSPMILIICGICLFQDSNLHL